MHSEASDFNRIEGAEHLAAAAADPKPSLKTREDQPVKALLTGLGGVGRRRIGAAAGMRMVMADDRPPRLTRRAGGPKVRRGVEQKGGARIGSRVRNGYCLFDRAAAPRQQPTNLAPVLGFRLVTEPFQKRT